jgi:hypothetical protein
MTLCPKNQAACHLTLHIWQCDYSNSHDKKRNYGLISRLELSKDLL